MLAIDFGRYRAVANIAVNGVGKIDDGGAARHRHDLAFWGKHIHSIGEKINLDMVPKLSGIARFMLNVEQRLQPLGAQPLRCIAVWIRRFVQPMRGNARFRHHMHGLGSHLELNIRTKRAHQGGVQ